MCKTRLFILHLFRRIGFVAVCVQSLLEIIVSGRASIFIHTHFSSSHTVSRFTGKVSLSVLLLSFSLWPLHILCLLLLSSSSACTFPHTCHFHPSLLPRHHPSLNSLSWTHTGGFCHRWVWRGASLHATACVSDPRQLALICPITISTERALITKCHYMSACSIAQSTSSHCKEHNSVGDIKLTDQFGASNHPVARATLQPADLGERLDLVQLFFFIQLIKLTNWINSEH